MPPGSACFIAVSTVHNPAPEHDGSIAILWLIGVGEQIMIGFHPKHPWEGARIEPKPVDYTLASASARAGYCAGAPDAKVGPTPARGKISGWRGRVDKGKYDAPKSIRRRLPGRIQMGAFDVPR